MESDRLGADGDEVLSHITGMGLKTIQRGRQELEQRLADRPRERMRHIINRLAQQTMRGGLSAYWWLPLDSISYTSLDAALEDEAEKLYVSADPS